MAENDNNFQRFSVKKLGCIFCIILFYWALSYVLIGFKSDQIILSLIFCIAYFGNAYSRKLILGFSIYILYWIVFDYMKAFPNYRYNTVHIGSLYNFEKQIFGLHYNGQVVTPNEFFAVHTHKILDVLSGLFYLCWIPVPLMLAIYFFAKNKNQFLQFSITFFVVNLMGFIIYYVYPAAPPWYISKFGTAFNSLTRGNTAGLQKFDDITGLHIFAGLYSKSSNVFAAMPSLHAAYPLIVLSYGIKNKLGRINILFALIVLGIWFAAVYSSHHYIADIIAGIICFVMGTMACNYFFNTKMGQQFLQQFLKIIE